MWGAVGVNMVEEIAKTRDGVGGVGGSCIEEIVSKKDGNGLYSYFWYDLWLGGTLLCVQFRCLFDLVENKSSTVVDMFSLSWGVGVRRGSDV